MVHDSEPPSSEHSTDACHLQSVEGDRWPRTRAFLWVLMFSCWVVEALSHIHETVPDGLYYLDIAVACAKGHWESAINGYWSPGYPVLLSFCLRLLKPSPYWEMAVVHAVDCLILVLALVCFEYFLNGLLRYLQSVTSASQTKPLPAGPLRAIGYTLFFWGSLFMVGPSLDTPDTLVLTSALLATGIILRVAAGEDAWWRFIGLGIVLGLGYLAKAAMFPLAFVFLAAAFLAAGNFRRALPRLAVALILLGSVSAPFVLLLSKSKGRFTFGESGPLNYANYVNGVLIFHQWQGGPPGTGSPIHPTRKVLDAPPVYEFGYPVRGSYPVVLDPGYWIDGVKPHFEVRGQLDVLQHTLDYDFTLLFSQLAGVWVGFFALAFWTGHWRRSAKAFLGQIFVWAPAVAAFGMYSLVHMESRFVAAFVILLWGALFTSLRFSESGATRGVVRCVTFAVVIILASQIAWSMAHNVIRLRSARAFPQWQVVQELRHDGIESGGRAAVIGTSPWDLYWSHLASVTIVAEIPMNGVSSYWAATPEQKMEAIHAFVRAGARAVVAKDVPPLLLGDGWERVGSTDFYVLRLQ